MSVFLKNSLSSLPVILKVIRKDSLCICGICRSEYDSMVEASTCLEHCWLDMKNLHPIVPRRAPNRKILYRCQYCCRDYSRETDALSCAKACSADRYRLHVQAQLIDDYSYELLRRRPLQLTLNSNLSGAKRLRRHIENNVFAERKATTGEHETTNIQKVHPKLKAPHPSSSLKRKNHPDKPLDAGNSQHPRDTQNKDSLPKNVEHKTPIVDVLKHKSEYDKQWTRQDAKYQCRYCNVKYYTKQEVEVCFHGHFNEDGYEKQSKSA